jgi:hypothetical protein
MDSKAAPPPADSVGCGGTRVCLVPGALKVPSFGKVTHPGLSRPPAGPLDLWPRPPGLLSLERLPTYPALHLHAAGFSAFLLCTLPANAPSFGFLGLVFHVPPCGPS